MNPATDHRTAPLALWRVASALIHTLFALFGGPEKLAARHTLTDAAHKLASDWLRTAEAMMRRLLLIEASAYVSPASCRKTAAGKMPAVRKRKLISFEADKPEQWRASFRCILDHRRPRQRDVGPDRLNHAGEDAGRPRTSRRFLSAWPLAERFEALIRAHNDPAPYAKRLARRLRAAPKLVARVLQTPESLKHRIPEQELRALCARCVPAFDST
jgi:hypothetical protein